MESELVFRMATQEDLPDIVRMLADDKLGATREKYSEDLSANYRKAFDSIAADSNQELTVVEMNGHIVATFQLTFIQYLTHHGGRRAQIEAVRTDANYRGQGIGEKVFDYIINRAREQGCVLVQLTTDKQRPDAFRFYEKIGFMATHEGMKLKL
jgi:ribosomal protein S18 acetylase RimI-like enzyme